MTIYKGIAATILFRAVIGSAAAASGSGPTGKRVLLDKEGGSIELRAAHTNDKETRDAGRRQLQEMGVVVSHIRVLSGNPF